MLHEIHEVLGVVTAWALGLTAGLGLVLFFFPKLRTWLPVPRTTWVRGHRFGALAVLLAFAAHLLTTDRYGATVLLGALAVALAGLLGLSLHLGRRHFRSAVRAKIALVAVGAVLLLAGHSLLEEEKEGHEAEASRPASLAFLPSHR